MVFFFTLVFLATTLRIGRKKTKHNTKTKGRLHYKGLKHNIYQEIDKLYDACNECTYDACNECTYDACSNAQNLFNFQITQT